MAKKPAVKKPAAKQAKRRSAWNHRVVRRYDGRGLPYLTITEVHYRDGKPMAFAIDWSPVGCDWKAEIEATEPKDSRALDDLRKAVESMRMALLAPILDERKDFKSRGK